jgi:hypothetical protein
MMVAPRPVLSPAAPRTQPVHSPMENAYKRRNKQLDDFDGAVDALPALERDMCTWGTLVHVVPARFDAVIRETTRQVNARALTR